MMLINKAWHNITGFAVFLLLILTAGNVMAQLPVWQWSVQVRDAKDNNGHARAYLWIPPDCKKVKAFVFAQNNMEEQSILEDPDFREAMGKLGFAEVWVSPASDLQFRFNMGAGETFNGIMHDLSDASGYVELNVAPFVALGHSAAASAPYYMAAWNPGRTLACISVSGQWPYARNVFAPDIWGDRNIDFVPALETMGEYENAATWSAEGLKERADHPLMPLSMLACPGEFHFATSKAKNAYLALFIKKTAQYRLPKNAPDGETPKLIPIDPAKTGWLADKWRFDQPPMAKPAKVGEYKGDATQAFWYFDEEMANATLIYESKHRNQKPQLIGFTDDGTMITQRDVHQQFNLKFEPLADGITFHVHTAFYDTVPGGSPRPAGWAHQPVGSRVGHSGTNTVITVNRITGPMIKLNDSTFQIHPRAGYWQFPHSYELWFSAENTGDTVYKPAVQQAEMLVPPRNSKGAVQHIKFNPLSNQKVNSAAIELAASSDSGLPVGFYIQDGPAEIVNGKIKILPIPPRAKFPVKVTVVAWQYGTGKAPEVQTAEPVEQIFWINK